MITYENQGANTFLVYVMDTQEKVDTLTAGMASNNTIPGVIMPSFTQNNAVRQWKYNISSKISLTQYFTGTVRKKQVLEVFANLIETIRLAEKYLLGEEDFLLAPEYIFVDVGKGTTNLLCFPVEREVEEVVSFYDFLGKLFYQIKFDVTEDCSYTAILMNYLNEKSGFSLEGLKKTIESCRVGQKQVELKKQVHEFVEMPPKAEERKPKTEPIVQVEEKKMEMPVVDNTDKVQTQAKSKKGILHAIFEKKEKTEKAVKTEKSIPAHKMPFQIPGMNAAKTTETSNESEQLHIEEKKVMPEKQMTDPMESVDYGTTENIMDDDLTVMNGQGLEEDGERKVMITRLSTGQKMEIDKEVFRMGKSSEFVDFYIGDDKTISRSHADILLKEDGVYIRDNNSLNHTYVNGNMVMAGREELLKNGDKVTLSEEVFEISIKS